MWKQSEGLTKEYDRLLEEHAKLQVSTPQPVPHSPPRTQVQSRPPLPSQAQAASAELMGKSPCPGEADSLLPQALQEAMVAACLLSLWLPPLLLCC